MNRTAVAAVALMLLLVGCGSGDDTTPDELETPVDAPSASAEGDADADPGEESAGMANPASVHCAEQGGTEETREDAEGDQAGVCVFPDGSECDSWAYYREECAPGDQPAA